MIKFLDGPHGGQSLILTRAPFFLRVVADQAGKIDALDQLEDTPKPEETITVYRIEGNAGIAHFDRVVNGRRQGIWSAFADYRYHREQPPDQTLRETDLWQQWATREARKLP